MVRAARLVLLASLFVSGIVWLNVRAPESTTATETVEAVGPVESYPDDLSAVIAADTDRIQVQLFLVKVEEQRIAEYLQTLHEKDVAQRAAAAAKRAAKTATTVKSRYSAPGEINGVPCGGTRLPPCSVLRTESKGNLNAYNATGCAHKDGSRGCYGAWQCDPRTCDGTGTLEEQTAEAARVWAGGKGCSHWNAC
jgi:ribosomal protein L12E/L44/L45/RPP1/RPP2